MKVELFPFQKKALDLLRIYVSDAISTYQRLHVPQVISFTAPTGSGKTIIMSSLIEDILFGNDNFPEEQDSIFIWLSDSPELNQQSKLKIDLKSDKIRLDQCIIVDDESFDSEYFQEGHIYFLNTQKLREKSNLTTHSDSRQYTIWETLQNTARDKSNHLYVIIDEAHRGMQGSEAGKATTIMQKFLKGSKDKNLLPMPVVIGMTATPERFDKLVMGTSSARYPVVITSDEVRSSGLLKDRIIITYPDNQSVNKDMAVLQAAADEWKTKWDHWKQYCQEQHYSYVNPVFLIQVLNTKGDRISETDLDDCLVKIEERTGFKFQNGDVVHAFGETSSLLVNGLTVQYEEPSRIAENKQIKIVFFKESLSTGWDCPRAETMMSFRHAADSTYIAQLLGRMIRTPMQMRIQRDETLNDVHLYLPYFNANTVKTIVDELQHSEGGDLPSEVIGNELGSKNVETYSIIPRNPKAKSHIQARGQRSITSFSFASFSDNNSLQSNISTEDSSIDDSSIDNSSIDNSSIDNSSIDNIHPNDSSEKTTLNEYLSMSEYIEERNSDGIDRADVLKFINDSGLLTYDVRTVKINDYQKSLFKLTRLLSQSEIYPAAPKEVGDKIVEMIHEYIQKLKESGKYLDLVSKVKEFKLSEQWFDVFGKSIDKNIQHDIYSTTDTDVERQFRYAEMKLGNEGIGNKYGDKYFNPDNPIEYKIDVIIFVSNIDCQKKLLLFSEKEFHRLNDEYRRYTINLNEKYLKIYNNIITDGELVSEHYFRLPETISVTNCGGTKKYPFHLFSGDDGTISYNLNTWEDGVLMEEMKNPDFVCWIRNPPRGSWSLCVPYKVNGEDFPMYPDFIIIRKDPLTKYVIDILEPHRGDFKDNFGKSKGLAEYARKNQKVIGRVQLIRQISNKIEGNIFKRIDLSKSLTREKVLKITNADELDYLFETDGFIEV